MVIFFKEVKFLGDNYFQASNFSLQTAFILQNMPLSGPFGFHLPAL
jgi:hypothetical protein